MKKPTEQQIEDYLMKHGSTQAFEDAFRMGVEFVLGMKGKCEHASIEIITEITIKNGYNSPPKKYISCEYCGEILNINRVTSRTIERS